MKKSKCPCCKERVAMRLEIRHFKIMRKISILKICSKCGWGVKEIKL